MKTDKQAFLFCPVCGTKYDESLIGEASKRCDICSYPWFLASSPTIGAVVINEDNEILMIERGRDPHKGSVDFPAGFCEYGDNLEKTLKKELKEEVNLEDVNNFQFFFSGVGEYPYKGIIKTYLCSYFVVRINNEQKSKIKSGDDAAKFYWYRLDQIPFELIAFDIAKQAIEEIKAQKIIKLDLL